jgi:hypothetical protein
MPRNTSLPRRLGRYVIEIIIIIIGITLSFALSDWDKRRSAQKNYQTYLENLQQDIKIDSLQMVNDYRSYYRKYKGIEKMLSYKGSMEVDTLRSLGEALNALSNFVEFLPNNNTFLMLSSTGDFKVFDNKDLVSQLIQLYQYDYAYIVMMGKEANKDRVNRLEPYLIENIFFEDQITFPKVRTNIPDVINDREFRNICILYQGSAWSAMASYRRALDRLRGVDSLINVELLQLEDDE